MALLGYVLIFECSEDFKRYIVIEGEREPTGAKGY
jgi:hypothetical protein